MERLFRKDYDGEFVILRTNLFKQNAEEIREWLPNTIENDTSEYGTAVILGNGKSRENIALHSLLNHKTGVRGKYSLQTYGCNALYRDAEPDFLVVVNQRMAAEIAENFNSEKTIAISTAENIIKHPGKFHIIPHYRQSMCAGAIATYMACFDGHKKVYLLGFDLHEPGHNNNIYAGTEHYDAIDANMTSEPWVNHMYTIFRTYSDVDFVRVMPTKDTPKQWRSCLNYREINKRDFVLEVDL